MMRTFALIGCRPPTEVNSPSCSTRSSRVCASGGMSPISSRNSVPPLACSKRPWLRVGRAGEGAALVAEQLALDQLARDRRHVDGNERTGAALAVIVQRAGHQLLAGARFAVDHHRQVGGGEPGDGAVDLLHRRAAADQRQAFVGVARLAARWHSAAPAPPARGRPPTAVPADRTAWADIRRRRAGSPSPPSSAWTARSSPPPAGRAGSCGCAGSGRGRSRPASPRR